MSDKINNQMSFSPPPAALDIQEMAVPGDIPIPPLNVKPPTIAVTPPPFIKPVKPIMTDTTPSNIKVPTFDAAICNLNNKMRLKLEWEMYSWQAKLVYYKTRLDFYQKQLDYFMQKVGLKKSLTELEKPMKT